MPGGIHPPVAVVTSWPEPNFVNPETHSNTYVVVVILSMVITLVVIFVRLWARAKVRRSVEIDDYLIFGAEVFAVAICISICLAITRYGFNRHVWDVVYSPEALEGGRQTVLAIEISYVLATGLTKLSVLFFVLRMTRHTVNRWIFIAIWVTIVFVIVSNIFFGIFGFVLCRPFSAFWHEVNIERIVAGYQYKCMDEGVLVVTAGTVAAGQDIIVTTLPLSMIWNMQLPPRKKWSVIAIFCAGYISCIMSILRIVFSAKLYFMTYDVTWEAPDCFLMAVLELNIGIICACIPAAKLFFEHYSTTPGGLRLRHMLSRRPRGTVMSEARPTNRISHPMQHSLENRNYSIAVSSTAGGDREFSHSSEIKKGSIGEIAV